MHPVSIIIVGHGSRDAQANVEFEKLVAQYRARNTDCAISHGYIELAQPSLLEALSSAATTAERVIILPLFLFAAGHVKNDIPLAVQTARERFPHVHFFVSRSLGVHPGLTTIAFERVQSAISLDPAKKTGAIVVGRGASDPDANADFFKLVRLFAEGRGFSCVQPCFIGIARPSFEETAELVARSRPDQIIVLPYFLFGGRLLTKLDGQLQIFTERYPWIKIVRAPHLGIHDKLFEIIDERIAETITGQMPLPCDACQYRTPLAGLAQNVGGVKALLWSIRHSFTHTQAMPHIHAHKPIKKHVLVCGNADCADRGSIATLEVMRRCIKDAGHEQIIRVTRTSCMGRCGEGPTVAIYPDGVWYRGVQADDAAEIVSEHLLNDRLIGRLVDNIMQ